MNVYLVTGEITVQKYMESTTDCTEETRLVYADSTEEAEDKFTKYFEALSSPYYKDVLVRNVTALEPIL